MGTMLNVTLEVARRTSHLHRRSVALATYALATVLAYLSAYYVRFDFEWPADHQATMLMTLPILVLIRHVTHLAFRFTTSRWRFVGVQDVLRLTGAVVAGSAIFLVICRVLSFAPRVPNSVIVIEAALSILYTASIWISYRVAFEWIRHKRASNGGDERRVVIIGAGESGYILAREMIRSMTGFRPVGFVDDDPLKAGMRLAGLPVLGSTDQLAALSSEHRADELILAVPQATPTQMRALVAKCESTGLGYRVLPSIAEVFAGNIRVEQLREVQIEDLLGREPVNLDLVALVEDLAGGCALVTGAAGSIGSELSRQIARHRPATLLILDQAETDLYYLELELREQHPDLNIVPIIRDVTDRNGIDRIFATFSPTHVFHAAAYKHVPMMEANVTEALRNNLFGSFAIADAAGRQGSRKFVLVSTDKAVRPSSVMGATKRLAEMVTVELQSRYPDTVFAAVRFGNVLGSNGSVIPIFKRQIAARRPLTVTHPDATRYFMTIPEAVQLILQASLLREIRGHIAMLEMGEPVRIVELAENLLRLSGRSTRDGMVFTGLRPGEKLHEELVAPEEETISTVMEKVRIIKPGRAAKRSVLKRIREWESSIAEGRDEALVTFLKDYFPDLEIVLDTSWRAARPAASAADSWSAAENGRDPLTADIGHPELEEDVVPLPEAGLGLRSVR